MSEDNTIDDGIFDVNDASLEEIQETIKNSSEVGIDIKDIKEKHWCFDTLTLFKKLAPISLIMKDKNEIAGKLLMKYENGSVLFKINNGESKASIRVAIENTSNVLDKEFIVDWKVLFSVLKNSGKKVLIIEKEEGITVSVLSGEIPFDVYKMDTSNFDNSSFTDDIKEYKTLPSVQFQSFLKRSDSSMALAVRPEDRIVRLEKGVACSNFLSSVFIQRNLPDVSVSLRSSDVKFLFKYLEDTTEFFFKETKDEYIFKTSSSFVSIPRSNTDETLGGIVDTIGSYQKDYSFSVSPSIIQKVLFLLRDMISNSVVVKFYGKDKTFYLEASTKSGKQVKFPILSADNVPDSTISIPLASVNTAVGMFKSENTISIHVDNKGKMIFENNQVEIIFGSIVQ